MNEVAIAKKRIRQQKWKKLIRQQQESDLTVRQCCQTNQVSEPSFYYRLRSLREIMVKSQSNEIVIKNTEIAELNTNIPDASIHYGDFQVTFSNTA